MGEHLRSQLSEMARVSPRHLVASVRVPNGLDSLSESVRDVTWQLLQQFGLTMFFREVGSTEETIGPEATNVQCSTQELNREYV